MDTSTAAASMSYRAFISYSHTDKVWADWLHKALETYRVPSRLVGQSTAAGVIPRRLLPVFRDRDELASATDLNRTVNAALAQSANLIVICSPHSAASRWVNEEVLAFKRLGHSERIFCLIVDGEPNAADLSGREAEECFAPALRFTLGADGRPTTERTEPIAADARPGKDGKPNAKLKLIAGMLAVGFDALKQREQQRRVRRMTAITALALVVMLITTTLAILAVIARGDAQRRQKQAEELVGFMLGDLNNKLREVNRLDILQSVDDKAMAYFASLPSKDVTDAALTMRIDALQKIGSVRQDQGKIPAALESYVAASRLAAELLRRSPLDVQRRADYASSLNWIGFAHWYQGKLAHALQDFQQASDTLLEAHAAKPADTGVAFDLSSALTNAGRVLETQGNFAAAKPKYEATLKITQELVAREPANRKWQSALGDAYDSLGKLALEQGQLVLAIREYRANQRVQQKLAALDPNDHNQQYELLISDAILGRTLGLCDQLDSASAYLGDAVAMATALISFDSTATDNEFLFARYSEQLGGLLRQQNKIDAAAAADARSLSVLEKLSAKDPTNAEWHQELARSRTESARLHLAHNDAGAAEQMIRAALDTIEPLRSKSIDDRNLILLAAQAEIVAGQAAALHPDMAKARASWERARTLVASDTQSGNDPNFLATQASALLLLDRIDAARPVVAKLAAMGYQTPDFAALTASRHLPYAPDPEVVKRIADALR
ncbi:MAG: TIR domain-containing protein [Rudaea sp.]